jgi:hypothetical protein
MAKTYAYISGWCAKDSLQHHRCQTTYGRLQTPCTCSCHETTVSDLDGQAELFEIASA